MKRLILGAMLLTALSGAWAADNGTGTYAANSRGCGDYVNDRKAGGEPNIIDEWWVVGYLTAYNTWTPDTYQILGNSTTASAMLWLDNYCKAHPLKNLADGMRQLIVELYPNRHRTAKDAGH